MQQRRRQQRKLVRKSDLVGKWYYETYKQTVNGQVFMEEQPYPNNSGDCLADFIQLKEDNTAILGDYFDDGDCTPDNETTDWSMNGKKITLGIDGEDKEYEIVSVSNNALTARYSASSFGITAVETFTFVKAN